MNQPVKVELFVPETPVSTQHAYVNRAMGRGKMIRFLSQKAKDFKTLLQSIVVKEYSEYITEDTTVFGDIDLQVTVYLDFKTRRKSDWDNYHKLWCDALEGYIYDNDTQIQKATVFKSHSPLNPGIRLIIEPFIKD